VFHAYQGKTPLGKPNKQQFQTQIQNRPNHKIVDNRKFPSRVRFLSPQGHKNYKNQNLCLPRKTKVFHEQQQPPRSPFLGLDMKFKNIMPPYQPPLPTPPYNENYYGE